MIHGIGTDIIDIKRIQRVINLYGSRFKKNVFMTMKFQGLRRNLKRLNLTLRDMQLKKLVQKL